MMHPSHYIFPTLTPRKVGGNICPAVSFSSRWTWFLQRVCFYCYNPSRGCNSSRKGIWVVLNKFQISRPFYPCPLSFLDKLFACDFYPYRTSISLGPTGREEEWLGESLSLSPFQTYSIRHVHISEWREMRGRVVGINHRHGHFVPDVQFISNIFFFEKEFISNITLLLLTCAKLIQCGGQSHYIFLQRMINDNFWMQDVSLENTKKS